MAVFVDCPQCGRSYRFPDRKAGREFRCKSCNRPLLIPRTKTGKAAPSILFIIGSYGVAALLVVVAVAITRPWQGEGAEEEKEAQADVADARPQNPFDALDFDDEPMFDEPAPPPRDPVQPAPPRDQPADDSPPRGELEALEDVSLATLIDPNRLKKLQIEERDEVESAVVVWRNIRRYATVSPSEYSVTQTASSYYKPGRSGATAALTVGDFKNGGANVKLGAVQRRLSAVDFEKESPRHVGAFVEEKRQGIWSLHYPDGKVRVRGSFADDQRHGTFRCFNEAGERIWEGEFHRGQLRRATGVPDGGPLYGELDLLGRFPQPVEDIAYSPESGLLAASCRPTGDLPRHVSIWNVGDWTRAGRVPTPGGAESCSISFSPSGRYLRAATNALVQIWEPRTHRLVLQHGRAEGGLDDLVGFLVDDRFYVAITDDAAIHADLESGESRTIVPETVGGSSRLAFCCAAVSNDKASFALATGQHVEIRDSRTGDLLADHPVSVAPLKLRFSSEGVVCLGNDGRLVRLETDGTAPAVIRGGSTGLRSVNGFWIRPHGAELLELRSELQATSIELGRSLYECRNVSDVAVSIDGRYWAATERNTAVTAFNWRTGQAARTIPDRRSPVFFANPDLFGCFDRSGSFYIYQLVGGGNFQVPLTDRKIVAAVVTSDGHFAVTGDDRGETLLWDLRPSGLTGRREDRDNSPPRLAWENEPTGGLPGAAFSARVTATDPDGDAVRFQYQLGNERWILNGGGDIRALMPAETTSFKVRAVDDKGAESEILETTLLPDVDPWAEHRPIFTYASGGRARIQRYKLQDDSLKGEQSEAEEQAYDRVAFLGAGDELVGTSGSTVRYWNLADGGKSVAIGIDPEVTGASDRFGELFICGTKDGRLFFWKAGTRGIGVTPRLDNRGVVGAVAVSPDNEQIAVACSDGKLRLLSARDYSVAKTYDVAVSRIESLTWSPDGQFLAAAGGRRLSVLEASTGSTRFENSDRDFRCVAFAERLYALQGAENAIVNFGIGGEEGATAFLAAPLFETNDAGNSYAPPWQATKMAVSHDGSTAAVTTSAGAALLVRLSDGSLYRTLTGRGAEAVDVAFSKDPSRIAVAYSDGIIQLWGVGDAIAPASNDDETEPPDADDGASPDEIAKKRQAALKLQLAKRFEITNPVKAREYAAEALKLVPKDSEIGREAKRILQNRRR